MSKIPHIFLSGNPEQNIKNHLRNNNVRMGKIIGKGNYGVAYIGESNGRKSIVKLIEILEETMKLDFEREVYVQKLAHFGGIAPEIYESFFYTDGNREWGAVVMEHAGQTLDTFKEFEKEFKKKGPDFTGVVATQWVREFFRISDQMERLGIIHGDFKFDNITQKDNRLYAIDFGFSQKYDPATGARLHVLKTGGNLYRNMPRFVKHYDLTTIMVLFSQMFYTFNLYAPSNDFLNIIRSLNLLEIWNNYAKSHLWVHSTRKEFSEGLLEFPKMIEQKEQDFGIKPVEPLFERLRHTNTMSKVLPEYTGEYFDTKGDWRITEVIEKLAGRDFVFERCLEILDVDNSNPNERKEARQALILLLFIAKKTNFVPPIPPNWETVETVKEIKFLE